jgi:hypothetical protein
MSASSRPTFNPSADKPSARFTATVDLPTPPLPLATAITDCTPASPFATFGASCVCASRVRVDGQARRD